MRLAGHALRWAMWVDDTGRRGGSSPRVHDGCECGERAPWGLSIRQTRQWHRDHKNSVHAAQILAGLEATTPSESSG